MREEREGERLFPEHIDHVFKIIDPFFAEKLVSSEWIGFVAPLAFKIRADSWRSELRFAHRGRETEGKYRVDQAVGSSNRGETFSGKAAERASVAGGDV